MNHFQSYNANPTNSRVGDCAVRAIATALGQDWEKTYVDLCLQGYIMHDLPNADYVWGEYLYNKGFKRNILPCDRGLCVTVNQFCEDNPRGIFIVCPKNHVVAVIDGRFLDTWNSGDEIINYYWRKDE